MALIVAIVNQSELAPVSDYRIDIYVNERHISGPFWVNGHTRADGWEALVKQWAKTLKIHKREK